MKEATAKFFNIGDPITAEVIFDGYKDYLIHGIIAFKDLPLFYIDAIEPVEAKGIRFIVDYNKCSVPRNPERWMLKKA